MAFNVSVSYSKLWKLLIDLKIKKTELKQTAHLSPGTYAKLNKDEYVSLEVLARICSVLQCDIGDICEVILSPTRCSE